MVSFFLTKTTESDESKKVLMTSAGWNKEFARIFSGIHKGALQ